MNRLRLLLIHYGDFRKSELTLFNEVAKKNRGLKVGKHDVVALISGNGKQIKFIHGFTSMEVIGGKTREVTGRKTRILQSDAFRIDGAGSWNPLMLANYAAAVGIELIGLKKFEETYRRLK
jgi:hypothetical protein